MNPSSTYGAMGIQGVLHRSQFASTSKQDDSVGILGSVSDIILMDQFRRFQTCAERRINQLRDQLTLSKTSDRPTPSISSSYGKCMEMWAQFSKSSYKQVIHFIQSWKRDRIQQVTNTRIEVKEEAPSDSIEEQTTLSLLLIELVFCENILSIVKALNDVHPDTLHEKDVFIDIEEQCLDFFENESSPKSVSLVKRIIKRKWTESTHSKSSNALRIKIHVAYSQIVGELSTYRLSTISSVFLKAVRDLSSSKTVNRACQIIKGMQFLHVDISTVDQLNSCSAFFSHLSKAFSEAKGLPALKDAICSLITNLLASLPFDARDSPFYQSWALQMSSLYEKMIQWSKKPKHQSIGLPMQAAILCVCEKQFFLTRFRDLLQNLLVLQEERKGNDQIMLFLSKLVYVYLNCIPLKDDGSSSHLIFVLDELVFHPQRKNGKIFDNERTFNALTLVVLILASKDFTFFISQMLCKSFEIAEMRANESDGTDPAFDQCTVLSLRVLSLLLNFKYEKDAFCLTYKENLDNTVDRAIDIFDQILSSLNNEMDISVLYPFQSAIASNILKIMTRHSFVETQQQSVQLFSLCLKLMPYFWPDHVDLTSSVSFLCFCMGQTNESIRSSCQLSLHILKERHRQLIPPFVDRFADVLLDCPFSRETDALILLDHLNSILQCFFKSKSETNQREAVDLSKIEAVLLLWLSSTNTQIRCLLLNLLKTISDPLLYNPENHPYQYPIDSTTDYNKVNECSLMQVLSDHTETILNAPKCRMVQDFEDGCISSRFHELGELRGVADVEVLIQTADESLWSILFAEIMRLFAVHEKKCFDIVFSKAERRVRDVFVRITGKRKKDLPLLESELYMFRNCAVVASISSWAARQNSNSISSENWLSLLVSILMKNTHSEIQSLVISALGNAHLKMFDVLSKLLMDCLDQSNDLKDEDESPSFVKSVLASLPIASKKTGTFLRTRFLNIVQVFRMIIEGISSEVYFHADELSHTVIGITRRIFDLLQIASTSVDGFSFLHPKHSNSIELLSIWAQFSVIVKRVTSELFQPPCSKSIDSILRFNLYNFFQSVSLIAEDSLNGVSDSRGISLGFSTERHRRKKESKELRHKELSVVLLLHSQLAMATLLLGPFFHETANDPGGPVFEWIDSCLERRSSSKTRDVGTLALHNFLVTNPSLLSICLRTCYSNRSRLIKRKYFIVLGEAWMLNNIKIKFAELLNLVLFKLGDASQEVRQLALDMLPVLSERRPSTSSNYTILSSSLPDSYLNVQMEISSKLCTEYLSYSVEVVSCIWSHLTQVKSEDTVLMLRYCVPWIQSLDLRRNPSHGLLDLIFDVTLTHSFQYSNEVEGLWKALSYSGRHSNIPHILGYVLSRADSDLKVIRKESLESMQKIVLYMSRVSRFETISLLCECIVRSGWTDSSHPFNEDNSKPIEDVETATVSTTIPFEKGKAEFCTFLLVEIAYEIDLYGDTHLLQNIAQLVHVGSIGLLHASASIRDACRNIMMHLVHSLCFSNRNQSMEANGLKESPVDASKAYAKELMDFLMQNRSSTPSSVNLSKVLSRVGLTEYGLLCASLDVESTESIRKVVNCFLSVASFSGSEGLASKWSELALLYVKQCRSTFMVAHSHQIYRVLCNHLNECDFTLVINDLVGILFDIDYNIQENLLVEILSSLILLVQKVHCNPSSDFSWIPKLIWKIVEILDASMSPRTINPLQQLLEQIIFHLSLDDKETQSLLFQECPEYVKRDFNGFQPIALKGLMYEETRFTAMSLISLLATVKSDALVDTSSHRYIVTAFALVPWLCEFLVSEDGSFDVLHESIQRACQCCLFIFLNLYGERRASLILEKYQNGQYDCAIHFIKDVAPILSKLLLQSNDPELLNILLRMLSEQVSTEFKYNVLSLIRMVFETIEWHPYPSRFMKHCVPLFLALGSIENEQIQPQVTQILCTILKNTPKHSDNVFFESGPQTPPVDAQMSKQISEDDISGFPIEEHHDDVVSVDDFNNRTWHGNWAKQRRFDYATNKARISRIQGAPSAPPTNMAATTPIRYGTYLGSSIGFVPLRPHVNSNETQVDETMDDMASEYSAITSSTMASKRHHVQFDQMSHTSSSWRNNNLSVPPYFRQTKSKSMMSKTLDDRAYSTSPIRKGVPLPRGRDRGAAIPGNLLRPQSYGMNRSKSPSVRELARSRIPLPNEDGGSGVEQFIASFRQKVNENKS